MANKMAGDRLLQYRWLKLKIQMSITEINRLQEMKKNLPGQELKEIKVQTSKPEYAGFTKIIEKIDIMQRRLEQDIEELLRIKQDIMNMLESNILDEEERIILKLRYLYSEKYQDIAKEIFRSERSVRRIHNRALSKLENNPE